MSQRVRRFLAIAATAAPFVLLLYITTSRSQSQVLLLLAMLAQLAPYVVWTVHAKEDERLSQSDRVLWWLAIWFGGVLGQVAYIGFRVWPDEPYAVNLSLSQPSVVPTSAQGQSEEGASDDSK